MTEPQFGSDAALRWLEIAEGARAIELHALHVQALLRGVDPLMSATAEVAIPADDAQAVLSLCETLADATDQLRIVAAPLHPSDLEICGNDLRRQAATTLAAGVADIHRVELLARSLPARAGWSALAEALRCTDLHESWGGTSTVGDILGMFQDADPVAVRHVIEQALLSPETRFDQCGRAQVADLAAALEAAVTPSGWPR